jgi:hypothetical protein
MISGCLSGDPLNVLRWSLDDARRAYDSPNMILRWSKLRSDANDI